MSINKHILEINTDNLKFLTIKIDENGKKNIFAKNTYKNYGMKDGYISNKELFIDNFKKELKKYEDKIKNKVDSIEILINSPANKFISQKAVQNTINQKIISDIDIEQLKSKILNSVPENWEVLDFYPIKYLVNDYEYYSDSNILNLESKKIEAQFALILANKNNIQILENIFGELKIEIESIIFAPSTIINYLPEKNKNIGILSININDNITSLSIIENDKIINIFQIKTGYTDFIKQYSIKNKIPFSTAEKELNDKNNFINLDLSEYFQNIKKKLEKFNKNYHILFPSGVFIYGDNIKIDFFEDKIKNILSLPLNKELDKIRVIEKKHDYTNLYSQIFFKKNKKKEYSLIDKIKKIFKF